MRNLRAPILAGAAVVALLSARAAFAEIDTMCVDHRSGPRLCEHWTCNPLTDYGKFLDRGERIKVARGTKLRVTLYGFGADFANGVQDHISGLGSSIVARGAVDKVGGSVHFGQKDKTGYVTVEIRVHDGATLGNGSVQVNWPTGHERIPLKIVEACSPTPTPVTKQTGGGAPGASIQRPIIGGGAPHAELPDLVATEFVNFRTGVLPDDCNGAFTGQRRFVQPDLKFGVRNISRTAVTTPFVVLLRKQDGTELKRVTVPGLAGNESRAFEFRRPQSEVCVVKGPNGFGCFACPGAKIPSDLGVEVVVDLDNSVTNEASETNNTRKIN